MSRVNFDLDVLRTFVTGMELGSFARAAERLGRSTSAISAQLKKLEEQAGTPVLRREGRGMVLTEAGETLLGYARRLLELNDEAAVALRDTHLAGTLRLGLQEDFADTVLPQVLGRFARAHPQARIDVRMGRQQGLLEGIQRGELDLALTWEFGQPPGAHARHLGDVQPCWIAGTEPLADGEPLALVMLDAPCLLRSTAIAALDHAGIAWRMAFTCGGLAGIWAAVAAGLGVAVRTPIGLPAGLRRLPAGAAGLPELAPLRLSLQRAHAHPEPLVLRLEEVLCDCVGQLLDAVARAEQ
ncbi:MAG: HTH-type transcriptional regulator YofA [Stenotrophomonas maltophilia]|nr:MAG: HTH-type transcriptional regulator YofA [Stenotrophomonas maltophilia]